MANPSSSCVVSVVRGPVSPGRPVRPRSASAFRASRNGRGHRGFRRRPRAAPGARRRARALRRQRRDRPRQIRSVVVHDGLWRRDRGPRNLGSERLVFEQAAAAHDHGGRLLDFMPHTRQVRERLGRDQPILGGRLREPHLLFGIELVERVNVGRREEGRARPSVAYRVAHRLLPSETPKVPCTIGATPRAAAVASISPTVRSSAPIGSPRART